MTDEVHQDELRLRVEEAMELHGLSQNGLAQRSGVGQSSISHFLRGKGLNPANTRKMVDWLEGKEEPPVPTTDEARRAIRLYRYLQALTDQGATLTVRFPDGSENALLVLW